MKEFIFYFGIFLLIWIPLYTYFYCYVLFSLKKELPNAKYFKIGDEIDDMYSDKEYIFKGTILNMLRLWDPQEETYLYIEGHTFHRKYFRNVSLYERVSREKNFNEFIFRDKIRQNDFSIL